MEAIGRELCGSVVVAHESLGYCLRDQIAHEICELLMCVSDVLAAFFDGGIGDVPELAVRGP